MSNLQAYQLVTFQPNNVLFRSKLDRKLYYYREDLHFPQKLPSLPNHIIVTPLQVQNGYLLQSGHTNIAKLLQIKSSHSFAQEEIVNTLSQILSAIQSLHHQDSVHGTISSEAIFINDFGELRLFFPASQTAAKPFYETGQISVEKTKLSDFRAFALIALQLMKGEAEIFKNPLQELKAIARDNHNHFSMDFILCLFFMLTQSKTNIDYAVKNFTNIKKQMVEQEYISLYNELILEKRKNTEEPIRRHTEKAEFTPPLIKHSNQQLSPRKVLQMTRKLLKIQDVQNKKVIEEGKKKKPSDTVLKKMSNGKAEGQKGTSSPGYKKILRDLRQTKQREDLFKNAVVTVKRMRTISKKKLN